MTKDAFRSLNSVTQLVLDALLEQQIEKLKFLSPARDETGRGTQQQPEMVAGVVGLMDAGASYRDARQHQQNDQRAAEVIFFPIHALSPSA
jgi:hypothetical protein